MVTWIFRKFPNVPNNYVKERITIGHYAPVWESARFDGPNTVSLSPISPVPGHNRIDTGAKWKGNGAKGGFDIHSPKSCPPRPALSIEKLQKISGSFTKSPLFGKVGETVFYEIKVRNTGNVSLALSNFTDPHCDAGTISGGPGSNPLLSGPTPELGEATIYTCDHVLTSTELWENDATVTGMPTAGGVPFSPTSNTVIVNGPITPEPGFSIEKLQKIEGSYSPTPLTGKVAQTVFYEIVVKNTGSTSLTFSNFKDEHCDSGTLSGGPGSKALEPGESTTWLCDHVLTSADRTAGSFSNNATVTGTPPGVSPITHTSNTVVVTLETTQAAGPKIYVGYADGVANDHGSPSGFPSPWKGAEGVTFIGCGFGGVDSCPMSNGADIYDAGAIRVEATIASGAISVSGASVVIGPCKYEPWPGLNSTIQPGHSLILTETGKHRCTPSSSAEQDNFDTSESFFMSPQYQQFLKTGTCSNDGYIPAITLTINGKATTVHDTGQTLNGGGIDLDICRKVTEAVNWVAVPSTAAKRMASTPSCRVLVRRPHHRGRVARLERCAARLRAT
jgi:hypothetical protein